MLKLTIFLSLILLISQANAGIVNLAWNTGISGRTTLVAPNDTIVWTVTDSNTHTVTSDNATFFDSGFITTNFTLNTVNLSLGSYPYHCNVHSFMTGTIVITTNVSSSDTLSVTHPSPSISLSNLPSISISASDTDSVSLSKPANATSIAASLPVVSSAAVASSNSASNSHVVVGNASSNSFTHTITSTGSISIGLSKSPTGTLAPSASVATSVVASSQVVAPSKTGSKSLSSTASGTPSESPAGVGSLSPTKSGVAQSQGATPSVSISHVKVAKTVTGLAAITCRQGCANAFISCKRTSRRLRPCRRAKKNCVSGCGTVNPN